MPFFAQNGDFRGSYPFEKPRDMDQGRGTGFGVCNQSCDPGGEIFWGYTRESSEAFTGRKPRVNQGGRLDTLDSMNEIHTMPERKLDKWLTCGRMAALQ